MRTLTLAAALCLLPSLSAQSIRPVFPGTNLGVGPSTEVVGILWRDDGVSVFLRPTSRTLCWLLPAQPMPVMSRLGWLPPVGSMTWILRGSNLLEQDACAVGATLWLAFDPTWGEKPVLRVGSTGWQSYNSSAVLTYASGSSQMSKQELGYCPVYRTQCPCAGNTRPDDAVYELRGTW